MAITQYQKIEEVQLLNSFNGTTVTALSDQVTSAPSFQYEVIPYLIDDNWDVVSADEIAILKIFPNQNAFLKFNPYSYYSFETEFELTNMFYHNEGSYVRGTISAQEYISGGYGDGVFNPFFILLKGREDYTKPVFNYSLYELAEASDKFLTDYESKRYITDTSYTALSMLNGSNYPNDPLLVTGLTMDVENDYIFFEVQLKTPQAKFDSQVITAFRGYIANPDVGDYEKSRIDVILSYSTLNNESFYSTELYYDGSWHVDGLTISVDMLDDNTKYFDIWSSNDALGTPTSIDYRVEVTEPCTEIYEEMNIMWTNRFGGVEGFNFKAKLDETFSNSKQLFTKNQDDINLSTGFVDKSRYTQSKQTFHADYNQNFKVSTGLVSSDLAELFKSMISSEYLVLIKDNQMLPIISLDSNIKIPVKTIDPLTNFQFNFTYNTEKIRNL